MYKLPHFTEQDQQKVLAFMQKNPFVQLIGMGNEYPVATHIPIDLSFNNAGKMILSGHMMKKTDHQLCFENNENVLVIFNGPHCYISASWYNDPMSGSTWNYMTVHARGKIRFTGEEGAYEAVKAITNKYEGTETVAAFNKLPKEYIASMVKAIIGFSIEVDSFENVFKLSQNKDADSRKSIIEHLQQRGDANSIAIAEEILRHN